MVCMRTNQHGVAQRLAFMVDGVALGLALIRLSLEHEVIHVEHAHGAECRQKVLLSRVRASRTHGSRLSRRLVFCV